MADQPTSRRSFLFGRSFREDDPWSRFLVRLKRSCEGRVSLVKRDSAPLARLEPARQEDVFHALSLCRQYGVGMALDGLSLVGDDVHRPVLQVGAGQAWGSLTPLAENLWRVQAGCPLDVMRAAGLAPQYESDATPSPAENLAQWIALSGTRTPVGSLARYGVQAIECLYPDGSIEVLGQFGVRDSQPLQSMAAQRSIPALFQLSVDPRLEPWSHGWSQKSTKDSDRLVWPLTYRLDALMDQGGAGINLAHLLLGHQGSLGWIVAAHMRSVHDSEPEAVGSTTGSVEKTLPCELIREIDMQVKRAMDPEWVFLSCPNQTG